MGDEAKQGESRNANKKHELLQLRKQRTHARTILSQHTHTHANTHTHKLHTHTCARAHTHTCARAYTHMLAHTHSRARSKYI